MPNSEVIQNGGILTATQSGATYQWFTCANVEIANEVGQTFTPTVVGDYYAVISSGDCSVTSECIPVTTLNIGDFGRREFRMYPNPVTDVLHIEYDALLSNVEVYNMLGQKLISRNVDAASAQIDMSQLPTGTFLVKAASGNLSKTYKVVRQ